MAQNPISENNFCAKKLQELNMSLFLSGFTLVRNGVLFDYPFLESFRSMIPLVDELVINVGLGDDLTLEKIHKFAQSEGNGKVVLFESDWEVENPAKKKGGQILSEQTNLALRKTKGAWSLYLQADEILHQEDINRIQSSLKESHCDPKIEGLLFDYVHFYGSFDVIQKTRSAYRREVRIIRNSPEIESIGDAQSFRKTNGEKLRVIHSGARIFHYGWVRSPQTMREKTFFMDQLYHGTPSPENTEKRIPHTGDNYRYKRIWGLQSFQGNHPQVMENRIQNKGWHWDLKHSPFIFSLGDFKKMILDIFEKLTGIRLFEYRSYHLIRKSFMKCHLNKLKSEISDL